MSDHRCFVAVSCGLLLAGALASAQPPGPGQGRAALAWHQIQKLQTTGSVLQVTAHPDDENGALLATARQLIDTAEAMQQAIGAAESMLLINDRVDVAAAVGAAVHLGSGDLPPQTARRLLGRAAIIGGTANSLAAAQRVAAQPVDYLGVGPVFGTASKGGRAAPMLGLEQLRGIVEAVDKPVIAIGSITAENAASVLETGAYGVAVLSAVVCTDDPQAAAAAMRAALDRALP